MKKYALVVCGEERIDAKLSTIIEKLHKNYKFEQSLCFKLFKDFDDASQLFYILPTLNEVEVAYISKSYSCYLTYSLLLDLSNKYKISIVSEV